MGQMERGEKGRFGWVFLILGILFIAAAVLAFINPGGSLEALAYAFAFLAVANGVWLLASNGGNSWRVVGGVVNILVGVFILFNIFWVVLSMPYIFAIWFIADSLIGLIGIGYARVFGAGYFWLRLILNVLGIVVGVLLLFQPAVAMLTVSFLVGFYLVLAGIECLVFAFSRRG